MFGDGIGLSIDMLVLVHVSTNKFSLMLNFVTNEVYQMGQGGLMRLTWGRKFTKEIKQLWTGYTDELIGLQVSFQILTKEVIAKEVNAKEVIWNGQGG